MARTHIQFQNQIISIVYNEKKKKKQKLWLITVLLYSIQF